MANGRLLSVRHSNGEQASGLARSMRSFAWGLANLDAGKVTIDELLRFKRRQACGRRIEIAVDQFGQWSEMPQSIHIAMDVESASPNSFVQPEHIERSCGTKVLNRPERFVSGMGLALAGDSFHRDCRSTETSSEECRSKKNEEKLSRLESGIREKLRTAHVDVGMMPPRPLLVPVDARELDSLLVGRRRRRDYRVCASGEGFAQLLGAHSHIRALGDAAGCEGVSLTAPSPAITAYVQEARSKPEPDSHFLDVLFTPYSAEGAKLMDKLLISGSTLEPSDWRTLCDTVRLTQNEWGEYLLEHGRLANLLVGLGGEAQRPGCVGGVSFFDDRGTGFAGSGRRRRLARDSRVGAESSRKPAQARPNDSPKAEPSSRPRCLKTVWGAVVRGE